MAVVPRYYDNDKSLIPYFALHITLKNHFASLLFGGDLNRIVYTTNDNALRKRADHITTNSNLLNNETDVNRSEIREASYLDFPFLNYKRNNLNFTSEFNRYNFQGFKDGVFIEDLGTKLRYNPNTLGFSGIFWVSNEIDLVQANRLLRFDSDGLTELEYSILIKDIEVPLWADLRYSSIDFDPEYSDNSWLESNKIHTISIDFVVHYFDIITNDPIDGSPNPGDYSLVDEVVFNYKVKNCLGNITDQEFYQLLYSELNP